MFKLTENDDLILRAADNTTIPRGHPFWEDYEAWRAEGNAPEPYAASVAPPKTVFAPREYLKRFTMAEYAAARTHVNIGVQWALDNLIGAQFVDINDPDTIAGLDLMVVEGVITPERRDEILTPPAA